MHVSDILSYCSTSKNYINICNQKETWMYLLNRDFNVYKYEMDPKRQYIELYMYDQYSEFETDTIINYLNDNQMDDLGYFNDYIQYLNDGDFQSIEMMRYSVVYKLIEQNIKSYHINDWLLKSE